MPKGKMQQLRPPMPHGCCCPETGCAACGHRHLSSSGDDNFSFKIYLMGSATLHPYYDEPRPDDKDGWSVAEPIIFGHNLVLLSRAGNNGRAGWQGKNSLGQFLVHHEQSPAISYNQLQLLYNTVGGGFLLDLFADKPL